MFREIEITPEEEEAYIRKVAETIHRTGMDVVGILFLETVKPLSFIGTQMGRFFLAPFLPALGEKIEMGGEKLLQVFEKHDNVEKLISMLEEMTEEDKKKEKEKAKQPIEGAGPEEGGVKPAKRGWRRFLPF